MSATTCSAASLPLSRRAVLVGMAATLPSSLSSGRVAAAPIYRFQRGLIRPLPDSLPFEGHRQPRRAVVVCRRRVQDCIRRPVVAGESRTVRMIRADPILVFAKSHSMQRTTLVAVSVWRAFPKDYSERLVVPLVHGARSIGNCKRINRCSADCHDSEYPRRIVLHRSGENRLSSINQTYFLAARLLP